jgi:hypothetical protein
MEIKFNLFKVDILWFEKYTSENPDTEFFAGIPVDEPEDSFNPMFTLTCLYDFDMNREGVREFYIDVFTKLPHYAVQMVRTSYTAKAEEAEELEWDDIFTHDILRMLVEKAIEVGFYHFLKLCKNEKIDLPPEMLEHMPEIPPEQIDLITDNLIDDYFSHRKPYLTANAESFNALGVKFAASNQAYAAANLSFLILDEVLFSNLHFSRLKNRKAFFAVIPEAPFYTLRYKCLMADKYEVTLNQVELHYFLICQDCAIQMTMGDKADILNESMVSRGFTGDVQQKWYEAAASLVNDCRGSVTASIESGEKFDWHKMLI